MASGGLVDIPVGSCSRVPKPPAHCAYSSAGIGDLPTCNDRQIGVNSNDLNVIPDVDIHGVGHSCVDWATHD